MIGVEADTPGNSMLSQGLLSAKKAPEIRATKRLSVDFVRKMPFCDLEVKRYFN